MHWCNPQMFLSLAWAVSPWHLGPNQQVCVRVVPSKVPQAGVGCRSRLTAWAQVWVLTCQQGPMLETMWGAPCGAGAKTASYEELRGGKQQLASCPLGWQKSGCDWGFGSWVAADW